MTATRTAPLPTALHDISKAYGRRLVLDEVSVDVKSNEIVGLIGANGAGKTTLLRVLVGLIYPDAGTVTLGGLPPSLGLRSRRVTYFAGQAALPDRVRVRRWASLLGAVAESERRRFRTLSRGTRQLLGVRIMLGRADRDLIVLDEPWEGLDPDGTRWLSARLRTKRSEGAGVLVSSHRLADMVDVCDRYAFVHDTRLHLVDGRALGPHSASRVETLRAVYEQIRRRSHS